MDKHHEKVPRELLQRSSVVLRVILQVGDHHPLESQLHRILPESSLEIPRLLKRPPDFAYLGFLGHGRCDVSHDRTFEICGYQVLADELGYRPHRTEPLDSEEVRESPNSIDPDPHPGASIL